MKILLVAIILIGAALSSACSADQAPPAPPIPTPTIPARDVESTAAWRADLAVLVEGMLEIHPDLFWRIPENEFRAAVEALDAKIPELTDRQIIIELARLASLIDGHTHLPLFQEAVNFGIFPIKLHQFSDGLFVVDADAPNAHLIGSRVTAIGGKPADEAFDLVAGLVSRDNESTVRLLTPVYLTIPEVMQALGIIDEPDQPEYALTTPEGASITVNLVPNGSDQLRDWTSLFIDLARLPERPEPLYLQNMDENFWYAPLEDAGSLYIQYNLVQDRSASGQSLRSMVTEIEAYLEENPADRIILDMRHNPGGNINSAAPLLEMLVLAEAANRPGGLAVIIGPQTFSAATLFAVDLEQNLDPVFAGEPTGGRPNLYGDVRPVILPNSGIRVLVSSIYWERSDPDDRRDWIEPQLEAPLTAEDFFNGRDPALEAILEQE
ncbi:MAG: hypothetical protein R3335_07095 [Anaerolineales bacterium]|nr:hypothetical protein [Anaerolineales bacterium]